MFSVHLERAGEEDLASMRRVFLSDVDLIR
jgi:hypothetical protein